MDLDFTVFQLRVTSALTPNVPLDSNLRAVIAPALHKLMRSCRASVGIHLFVNPEVNEAHALILGKSKETLAALLAEEERRHGPVNDLVPSPGLPTYVRLSWKKSDERDSLYTLLREIDDERFVPRLADAKPLKLVLENLQEEGEKEFPDRPVGEEDSVLVLPLRSRDNPRLGYFVLWSPAEDKRLRESQSDPRKQEGRVAFRRSLERLVVRLFTNFYGMRPDTYLPSYCRSETKKVTLLCATLRYLDRLSASIQKRNAWTAEQKSECIQNLIRRFNEIVGDLVRRNHGRIDQLWGDGVLAVFGEYLDTPDNTPRPGCKYALETASQLVDKFRISADEWLKNVFILDEHRKLYSDNVAVSVSVAIHHGEVTFDYVGSKENVVYAALGQQVSLVRHLVALVDDEHPILLSGSAEYWSRGILRDVQGAPAGQVHKPRLIHLPGHPEEHSVFPIVSSNIDLQAP